MKNGHGIDSKSFAGGTQALPVKGFSIFANRWTASKTRTHLSVSLMSELRVED
jgi:hypothetical protein